MPRRTGVQSASVRPKRLSFSNRAAEDSASDEAGADMDGCESPTHPAPPVTLEKCLDLAAVWYKLLQTEAFNKGRTRLAFAAFTFTKLQNCVGTNDQ
jgi:hypothetical protein